MVRVLLKSCTYQKGYSEQEALLIHIAIVDKGPFYTVCIAIVISQLVPIFQQIFGVLHNLLGAYRRLDE